MQSLETGFDGRWSQSHPGPRLGRLCPSGPARQSRSSKRLPRSLSRTLSDNYSVWFGYPPKARCEIRISPTVPRSCASPKVADYHQPRNNAYARFQWSTGVQTARRLDHAQRRMCAQRKGHRGDAASVLLYAIGGWWALE